MIGIDDCYYLGYVVKPKGLKGEFTILLDVSDPSEYSNLESVFVEINKQLVPFFLRSIRIESRGKASITIEDELDRDEINQLKGCQLFLPLDNLPKLEGTHFYYHEVEGFEVIDEREGHLGKLSRIQESAAQDLIVVDAKGKEVLIPILENTVIELDRDKKTMTVASPEGLIDLYLKD